MSRGEYGLLWIRPFPGTTKLETMRILLLATIKAHKDRFEWEQGRNTITFEDGSTVTFFGGSVIELVEMMGETVFRLTERNLTHDDFLRVYRDEFVRLLRERLEYGRWMEDLHRE